MCGIVGHLGPRNSVEIVMEGLRRLEYRGYDSAGVSFKDREGNLVLYKKEGKIENLEGLLKGVDKTSHIAIGHTRWATHGGVNDVNAHPHHADPLAIVHNGIIENADELRDELIAKGFKFLSETDSEVFLGLMVTELATGKNFLSALISSFKRVTGNSAFVILDKSNDEIWAVKKSAPLVCGTKKVNSEALVSSDPYALVGAADTIYFPEDNVICQLSSSRDHLISFWELDGKSSKRFTSKKQDKDIQISDKGKHEHFMMKEIYEQPDLIRGLANYYILGSGKAQLFKASANHPAHIYFNACGTAWHAGLLIRDYIEKENRIKCTVELANEFRYRSPIFVENDLAVFISQSGESADTLAALELCKENKVKTLSIINVEGSSIYRGSDQNLLVRAGVEIGVASTKAFTQQVLTGYLWSKALKGELESKELKERLDLLAQRIEKLLDGIDKLQQIASKVYDAKGFIFTGRGLYYPIALEGALKLKEIAYVQAQGYAAGELKHGPIALIDDEIVNIAIVAPELYEKTYSNVKEVKARRGVVIAIGQEGDTKLQEASDYFIGLNFTGLFDLAPLYVNVVNQILSYYMAKMKGTDIDKPRNLAKSVTVE